MNDIQFTHTNIVARDWRRLVGFYVNVFGCTVVPPERDLMGRWLDKLTNISDVHIKGAHVALPGYDGQKPTLEIFSYSPEEDDLITRRINSPGLAHIAFSVSDVEAMVEKITQNGGGILGSVVTREYENLGTLTVAYCSDPEGNYIEIQNWSD